MWDLPGPGIEPVSPTLASGFLTTGPPGKSFFPGKVLRTYNINLVSYRIGEYLFLDWIVLAVLAVLMSMLTYFLGSVKTAVSHYITRRTKLSVYRPVFFCCLVAKLCLTLGNTMHCSVPGFPVLHYLPEFAQTHVRWVSDSIQPSHSLSPRSPLALNLSQHQRLSSESTLWSDG